MTIGMVIDFDDAKGWGTVRAEDGRDYFFHCTAIADGTRTIAPSSTVTFAVVPGRLGRWEATEVVPR